MNEGKSIEGEEGGYERKLGDEVHQSKKSSDTLTIPAIFCYPFKLPRSTRRWRELSCHVEIIIMITSILE
jgi:hypothetical protein